MKNIITLILGICTFALISCKKTDEPAPVEILSVTIDPTYILVKDNWIFVHDANGLILDYKQINTPGTYSFKSASKIQDNKISVTIFTHDSLPQTGMDAYVENNLRTTLNIPAGQKWNLKILPTAGYSPNNEIGTTQLTLSGQPNPVMAIFSENTGDAGARNGNIYTHNFYTNYADFILTVASDDDIRYQTFTGVNSGDQLTADFTTMKSFDHVVDVVIPPGGTTNITMFSNFVVTDPTPNSYSLYFGPFDHSATHVKLGYLDRFTSYSTIFSLQYPTYQFNYRKIGPMPTAIIIPDQPGFAITDNSFLNFSFSSTSSYTYRRTTFYDITDSANKFTQWIVMGPPESSNVSQFPASFSAKYPAINPANLRVAIAGFNILPSVSWQTYIDTNYINITLNGEEAMTYVR